METEAPKSAPILEIAWQRHADLDLAADRSTKAFYDIRKMIAWLGILATLFAILTQQLPFADIVLLPVATVVRVLFIATSVLVSIFAAFSMMFYSGGDWLIYRAGAEEIRKEIFLYRTVRKNDPRRHQILRRRLAQIQKQLSHNLKELAFEGYKGPLPSHYNPNNPHSDPGFHDLTGDEYVKYRLKHQRDWHNNRIIQRKRERRWMNIFILTFSTLGGLMAALGGFLAIWVVYTSSITAALLGWRELRKVDETIRNYSKVVTDLTLLYDWWQNLEVEERTEKTFHKLVLECEQVLWAQNVEYTRLIQEVDTDMEIGEEANLVEGANAGYDYLAQRIQ